MLWLKCDGSSKHGQTWLQIMTQNQTLPVFSMEELYVDHAFLCYQKPSLFLSLSLQLINVTTCVTKALLIVVWIWLHHLCHWHQVIHATFCSCKLATTTFRSTHEIDFLFFFSGFYLFLFEERIYILVLILECYVIVNVVTVALNWEKKRATTDNRGVYLLVKCGSCSHVREFTSCIFFLNAIRKSNEYLWY